MQITVSKVNATIRIRTYTSISHEPPICTIWKVVYGKMGRELRTSCATSTASGDDVNQWSAGHAVSTVR